VTLSDATGKGVRGEHHGRMGISQPPFLGMMKLRDRGIIPDNAFDHLENTRFLGSRVITVRGGEYEMGVVEAFMAVDGIFDCGEAGIKPTSDTPVRWNDDPIWGGEPPTSIEVDFNAVGTVNDWDCEGIATSDANKVTAVGAVGSPYIKPGDAPGDATHTDQLFKFSDAAVTALDDDAVIADLLIHATIVKGTPGGSAYVFPFAGLNGIHTTGGYYGPSVNAGEWESGVEFTLRILRPGGGQWYGRDLKAASCEFGIYVEYQPGDAEPWVDRLYFSFTVGG
jgi:hypothetical protein